MRSISCPICNKRVCDSDKSPKIAKASNSNLNKADLIIKCHNCKSQLAIKIPRRSVSKCADKPPEKSGILQE